MRLPIMLSHCLGLGLVERQSLELLYRGCKGAITGKSKLEMSFSFKCFIWDFMWFYQLTSRVLFQPILFYDYVLTLGNNVK